MPMRYVKIALLLCIALMCLVHATQNVVNLGAAFQSLAYVMGNSDHAVYAASLGPAISSPVLVWLAVALVLLGEYSAGLCTAYGTWKLWSARAATPADFESAKQWGLVGCGLGMLVWLGLFSVVGGAYFQMWQTQVGDVSQRYAFFFVTMCALVLLVVRGEDR